MKQTEMALLREFAKFIINRCALPLDGETHSRGKDSAQLVREFKESRRIRMNQSDILNFAINGVRKEIEEGIAEVKRLQCVLAELLEHDKTKQEGFVPVHEWEIKDD